MLPLIKIKEELHTRFRVESELKSDAKGGYIQGKISLPDEAIGQNFKLALYDIHDQPHTNLLFVTPFTRQIYGQNASKKDLGITPDSHYVSVIYKNGTYMIDHENHPYLKSLALRNEPIVGPQFWNPQEKKFTLGPEGLRLTVLKPLVKGNNNSKITESKMRIRRGISKECKMDNTKVKLGLEIAFENEFLHPVLNVYYSNVIEDTAEYDLVIADSCTKAICNNGKFLLKVELKKGKLTKSKISMLELKLVDEYNTRNPGAYLIANNYKILSQKDVQFYIPETYKLYDFQTNLKLELFVHYKDGTSPKIEKENYIKLINHTEALCQCQLQSESVETFLRANPKLKEQSRFLKRKFSDNLENEDFADIDQYIHSNDNTLEDDLDDIFPSFSPSKVEIFDHKDKKIGDLQMSSSIYITIKVTNMDKNTLKNQSKIDINSDGSMRMSSVQDDHEQHSKIVDRTRVKTAKFGPPIEAPKLFAEGQIASGDGPSSKPLKATSGSVNAISGSVNAISWRQPSTSWRLQESSKPRLVYDFRNYDFPEELMNKGFKIGTLKTPPVVEIRQKIFKETEEDLTLNCLTIVDEDEKSSQKSNSTTEEVATKSTKSGGDTGAENSESDSDEEYVFPDLRGGGISNTSSLKDIEDWQKMPKIQQGMMRIAGWHEKWLRDPNNEIEDLEIEKQDLEDENLDLKEELKELEQKIEEYRLRTKNSLAREENLRYEKDALEEENNFLKLQKDDLEEEVNLLKNELEQTRQELQRKGPKQCKFFKQNKFCKFRSNCRYSHYK